jgi:hypothetical protein
MHFQVRFVRVPPPTGLTAPLPMPDGSTVPPTGKHVVLRFCEVWRIRDGKVISLHNYGDNLSLLQQLGLMPGA